MLLRFLFLTVWSFQDGGVYDKENHFVFFHEIAWFNSCFHCVCNCYPLSVSMDTETKQEVGLVYCSLLGSVKFLIESFITSVSFGQAWTHEICDIAKQFYYRVATVALVILSWMWVMSHVHSQESRQSVTHKSCGFPMISRLGLFLRSKCVTSCLILF